MNQLGNGIAAMSRRDFLSAAVVCGCCGMLPKSALCSTPTFPAGGRELLAGEGTQTFATKDGASIYYKIGAPVSP